MIGSVGTIRLAGLHTISIPDTNRQKINRVTYGAALDIIIINTNNYNNNNKYM